jgi:uncharacterized membrane protein
MRFSLLIGASLVSLGASCASAPAETWEDALAGAGHEERNDFCGAYTIIHEKCVRCHSDPPTNGAPFALDTYAAIAAPSASRNDPERIMADRMFAAVESGFMPYTSLVLDPPVEALTCEERATLLAWLRAPSPPPAGGEAACADSVPRLLECEAGAAGAGAE